MSLTEVISSHHLLYIHFYFTANFINEKTGIDFRLYHRMDFALLMGNLAWF